MNAQQETIARRCLTGAETGTLSFPQMLGMMAGAGLEGYLVDYRHATATYYDEGSGALELPMHAPAKPVASGFDATVVQEAIREAQANAPGYSYAGFCTKVTAAGCAGYLVSIPGRRVVYFGRTGETHVEHFPGKA